MGSDQCDDARRLLSLERDGELQRSTRRRLLVHVERCAACAAARARLAKIGAAAAALPRIELHESFARELRHGMLPEQTVSHEAGRRSWRTRGGDSFVWIAAVICALVTGAFVGSLVGPGPSGGTKGDPRLPEVSFESPVAVEPPDPAAGADDDSLASGGAGGGIPPRVQPDTAPGVDRARGQRLRPAAEFEAAPGPRGYAPVIAPVLPREWPTDTRLTTDESAASDKGNAAAKGDAHVPNGR